MSNAICRFISIATFLGLVRCAHGVVQLNFNRELRPLNPHLSKRESDSVLVLDNLVSYYRAEVMIGTPPQPVSVQIDTGSSDLWVISADNPLCKSRLKCSPYALFDTRRSSTYHRNDSTPFAISYGDSTYANGSFAQDIIQIGGLPEQKKGWSLRRLLDDFGRTNKDQGSQQASDGSSGIITLQNANFAVAETANSTEAVWGIGMESTESMVRHVDARDGHAFPTYPNLPAQMKQQGYIKSVAYSLWLNDLNSSQGSILFGGVDHAKYLDTLQTVPMVSSYQGVDVPMDFSVMLHGISAYNDRNETASIVNCSLPFLLDSGTTYSQLPAEFLEPIMETIGAIFDDTDGVYVLSSEQRALLSNGGLTFNLSGIEINVAFDEFLIPIGPVRNVGRHQLSSLLTPKNEDLDDEIGHRFEDPELNLNSNATSPDSIKAHRRSRDFYLVGIYPVSIGSGSAYILGDTFLRSAYVVYDLERKQISLANTIYNATNSDVEEIGSTGIPSAVRAPYYSNTVVVNEVSTFAATDLYTPEEPQSKSVSSSATSGTATITQMPSHAAPWMTAEAENTSAHKHAGHNGGSYRAPLAPVSLLGVILTLWLI